MLSPACALILSCAKHGKAIANTDIKNTEITFSILNFMFLHSEINTKQNLIFFKIPSDSYSAMKQTGDFYNTSYFMISYKIPISIALK